ncbi:Protein SYM1 [Psilocybe cubensis]|uniref:Protein SYM1 n=2 Tax=Psilocybe cubensis TaxID=181762 RepID=A0ACB8HHG9_PSICU|nr:Protein SYM1 [Psilocybe cubensis]KAH9487139.1 Protein SYM1 [Psilocybe cubensis]
MAALTLARAYQHSFDTHPYSTLAVTGGCLNALGDVVAQVAQRTVGRGEKEDVPKYDVTRTARFFAYGVMISPFMGRWNLFLERRFPLRAIKGTNKVSLNALGKRVAADQLFMAPLGLAIFLSSMGIMEGRSPRQIGNRFKDLYSTALIANWRVWPLAQLINFRYMPLPYRVPFSQACGVFWTLYLSILNSEEDVRQDKELADRRQKVLNS